MSLSTNMQAKNIRWKILAILHEARRTGKAESGGWIELAVLRKLLDSEGHPLSVEELRDYCVYLEDADIRCLELKKLGDSAPYRYKYRITARGVRAVNYEERVAGIGIYSTREDQD